MGFVEDIKALSELARRFESYRLASEAEKIALKAQIAEVKEELHQARQRLEPGSRRVSEDCLRCGFRLAFIKAEEAAKDKGKEEVI